MKKTMFVLALMCAAATLVGCGDDDDDDNKGKGNGSGSGVVSCDIVQAGLHYCEEFRGATGSADTGCPKNMTGFTPGTGCSRDDLAGSCTVAGAQQYEAFFYGSGAIEAAAAAVCPNGSYEPSQGTPNGTGGGSSSAPTGTCADLLACCNKGTGASKDGCLMVYDSAKKSGDKSCAAYLGLYKLANNCQ